MQNSLNKEGTIVEFTSKTTSDSLRGVSVPGELNTHSKMSLQQDTPKVTPIMAGAVTVVP